MIDWFDVLAVQGTFRSLLQHHNLKASIHQHSAFFTIQLSQQYTTTGKAIALTVWSFVGRVMSLLFNTLSRFVITFLPRSNCLLISSLLSLSAVILEPKMRESVAQFSPVAQLCLTLCDPMDCSMPGFPVPHQLLELAQTHVHQVSDAIQPSHPLSSPSPASNLSQHQGLFQ